ncbi:Salicylate 1-monooxygenase [Purpureocillium takamizusanense]|uniref:Salicylate 1-monooxygenase n=1 Tax=Purpureocillium takamizusanense TaxID=2060973 RepID=A0A9Q8QKJ3_9HYPO|nr:Salicylate 1-monooxygenase [Purpureocillium takamizusanense]UNI22749.1 Salicylate 1-monooxygenase [Purpureocillium takamizusanense]
MPELNVVIVGAGIAGLTCAITLARYKDVKVTVVEKYPSNSQIGNGIQIPCNAARVMQKLGLLDQLIRLSHGPSTGTITMNYSDGKVINERDFTNYRERYGSPWLLAHRVDYMNVLYTEACNLGVKFMFGCEVEDLDFDKTVARLSNGDVVHGDVIVGCDGVKSVVRSVMHPTIETENDESLAYRALFTPEQVAKLSPEAAKAINQPSKCLFWLGADIQIVFYSLRGGSVYNLVVSVIDDDLNARTEEGDSLALLRQRFADWDPALQELMGTADGVARFQLLKVQDPPFWSRGNVTLMGDAAHYMLPYLGQGAAMCAEDGFVLGTLLGRMTEHVNSNVDIQGGGMHANSAPRDYARVVLDAYEGLRHQRRLRVAKYSRAAGEISHMPDEDAQHIRSDGTYDYDEETCISDWPWIDSRCIKFLLLYKADEEAEREFARLVASGALDTRNSPAQSGSEPLDMRVGLGEGLRAR